MFNGRMLNIIRYLKEHGEATYKEMAKALGISERSIRYDVDRINDILSLERLPEIEKHIQGAAAISPSPWTLRAWKTETRWSIPAKSGCPFCC